VDLAGPKIRTGELIRGPKVRKFRPTKNNRGEVNQPFLFWLGVENSKNDKRPFLPISEEYLTELSIGNQLFFLDARGKNRRITIVDKQEKERLASISETCYFETGMKLYFDENREEKFIIVGELPNLETSIILNTGDYLSINRKAIVGEPTKFGEDGKKIANAHISCTIPEVFDEVKIEEPIHFDDGKISGVIKEVQNDRILVEITHTFKKEGRLLTDKGINLPHSKLSISGLNKKDKSDLKFIIQHADAINMSFVNSKEDVQELLLELNHLKANPDLGVILKIETQNGFNNLTEIILEAMQLKTIGVMIARGDLAIETGWENIGRVQQEILFLCEAAHIPDIFATQVLESLAKKGIPSRAEITDAIKAQQADCVMLNKGAFILKSIKFLDKILKDIEPYRDKSARLAPALKLATPKE